MTEETFLRISVRIFILFLVVTEGRSESVAQSSEYDEPPDDACRRLDPIPERTSVIGETEIGLIDFLHNGSEDLIPTNQLVPEDVILVLGNTGSGKTTLTQMIAGDLAKLHAVLTHSGQLVIVDDMEKIGAPSTTSRTIIPEMVISPDKNFTYYDCPGFDDTRGPVKDLAANYFVNRVIQGVSRVKLLFLVTHSSVQLGNDRLDFDLLAHHATTFVKNLHHFETSIGLVVTKVNGYSNINGRVLTDKQILRSIVEFLRVYKNDIQSSLPNEKDESKRDSTLKKIQFVDILLTKEKEWYPRLSFSRNPDSCGPLSESPIVTATRKRVLKVIQNLEFSPVGSTKSNFGFTLKDSTVLKVLHDYTNELNNAVVQEIRQLMNKVKEWYGLENLRDTVDLPMIGHKLLNIWDNVDALDTNETIYPTNVASELSMWFQSIGFEYPGELQNFMEEKQSFFEFFDMVTGREVERKHKEWIVPVVELQNIINGDKEDYKLDILNTWVKWTNDKVKLNVQTEVEHVKLLLNLKLANEQTNTPIISNDTWNMLISSGNLDKIYSTNVEVFGGEVRQVLHALGYNLSSNFDVEMTRSEHLFKTYEDFLNSTVERDVDSWKIPILGLKQNMERIKTEYFNKVKVVYVADSNKRIQECFSNLRDDFSQWFGKAKQTEETVKYPLISIQMRKLWKQAVLLANLTIEDPIQLLLIINNVLQEVGYNSKPQTLTCLTTEKNHLKFFDEILGESVPRSVSMWTAPILEMKHEIDSYKTQYLALIQSRFVADANKDMMIVCNKTLQPFYAWAEINLINNYDNVNGIGVLLQNVQNIINKLEAVEREDFLSGFVYDTFTAFRRLGYPYPARSEGMAVAEVYIQSSRLLFFDEMTGTEVEKNVDLWKQPLVDMIGVFHKTKQRSLRRAEQFIGQANDNIASRIVDELNLFMEYFERKLVPMNISSIVEATQKAYLQISRIENSPNLTVLLGNIQSSLEPTGYRLSSDFMSVMKNGERYFSNLEGIPDLEVKRQNVKWFQPILNSKDAIYNIKIWYEFCTRVNSELGGYGFQARKPGASVFGNLNWIHFLEKHAFLPVNEEIQQIGLKFSTTGSQHLQILLKIVQESLGTENIECKEYSTMMTVTGKYVRLKRLFSPSGNLGNDQCANVRQLEVYATEKIFVDASVAAIGKELRVVLVAPIWEVVGSPNIDLSGSDAEDYSPSKADNGIFFGDRGSHGEQGIPGGPGGSFLGISRSIINAAGLQISANGGRGGKGQNGGDGVNGYNGQIREYDTNEFNIGLVITGVRGQHGGQGGDGGDGGWGGKGGIGGRAGQIEIISKDKERVMISSDDGAVGEMGYGGTGGLGGRGSVEHSCRKLRIIGIPIPRSCNHAVHSDGERGTDGMRGGPSKQIIQPRTPELPIKLEYAKGKYDRLYGEGPTRRVFGN